MTQLLTVQQAAELLNASTKTVWRLVGLGEIPTIKVTQKSVRIRESDLEQFIDERQKGGWQPRKRKQRKDIGVGQAVKRERQASTNRK